MIDAAVVAAYLGAAVARGGRRMLDSAVDAGLDRLSAAVSRRLGHGPESDLAHGPDDPAVRAQVARGLATAARRDPAFARELASLAAQLDRSGGRRVITNTVRAQVNVQAFDGGHAHYGDYYEGDRYTNDYDPGDELVSGTGPGRFVAIIGLLLAMAGFLGVGWVIYDAFGHGGPGSSPLDLEIVAGVPVLPVAFVMFLAGGILHGLGTSASKAARKRREQRARRRPAQWVG
jgi:hypothetical protein